MLNVKLYLGVDLFCHRIFTVEHAVFHTDTYLLYGCMWLQLKVLLQPVARHLKVQNSQQFQRNSMEIYLKLYEACGQDKCVWLLTLHSERDIADEVVSLGMGIKLMASL